MTLPLLGVVIMFRNLLIGEALIGTGCMVTFHLNSWPTYAYPYTYIDAVRVDTISRCLGNYQDTVIRGPHVPARWTIGAYPLTGESYFTELPKVGPSEEPYAWWHDQRRYGSLLGSLKLAGQADASGDDFGCEVSHPTYRGQITTSTQPSGQPTGTAGNVTLEGTTYPRLNSGTTWGSRRALSVASAGAGIYKTFTAGNYLSSKVAGVWLDTLFSVFAANYSGAGKTIYGSGNGWNWETKYSQFSTDYALFGVGPFSVDYQIDQKITRSGGSNDLVRQEASWLVHYDMESYWVDPGALVPLVNGTNKPIKGYLALKGSRADVRTSARQVTGGGQTTYSGSRVNVDSTFCRPLSYGGADYGLYWSGPTVDGNASGVTAVQAFHLSKSPNRLEDLENQVHSRLSDIVPSSFYAAADAVQNAGDSLGQNHLEALVELRQIAELLPDPKALLNLARSVRRRDVVSVVGNLGDLLSGLVLAGTFGWRPMLSDISIIREKGNRVSAALEELRGIRPLYGRFNYTFPEGTFGRSAVTLTTKAKLNIRFSNAAALAVIGARAYGLFPDLQSLWDLQPWSFAIDWFTNMGTRLGDIDNQALICALDFVSACYTYEVTATDSSSDLVAGLVLDPSLRERVFVRHKSTRMPVLRESVFDFRAPQFRPNIGVIASLLWTVLT